MKIKLPFTFIFFIAIQVGFSQDFDREKLDNYFDVLEKNNKFMGSVAVAKNGELIYTKTVGLADVENNIKANQHTKYRIGSISKSFTAVLVLKAVEEEKVKLDQSIFKWFPKIKKSKKITIKQLLTHRSGIHNFTENKSYSLWNTQSKTEKEMIAIIVNGGTDFKPGSKAQYSNSNFVLLSFILEKIYRKSYTELIQEYIAEPIGLSNTYVFGKINTSLNESKSYFFSEKWNVANETDSSIPLGAGALTSTPTDLVLFLDALFNGKLINRESLELMKTMRDGYGIGFFQIPFYSSLGYGHTGGIDGFNSIYSYFEEEDLSYALVSNGTNFSTNDVSIAVLSAVFEKEFDVPEFSTFNLNSEDLDKYLGVYSSKDIPIKITFTKDGNTLIGQGTGQPALVLEASEQNIFKFYQAGIMFEFFPKKKTLVLFQNGKKFNFTKNQ